MRDSIPPPSSTDTASSNGRCERDLVESAQSGSLAAFEELVYRYEARIYAFLLNCCRSDADARDLTQDTFVRAFRALASFNVRQPFGPWLFTIARRKWLDRARIRKPSSLDEVAFEITDPEDPAELLIRAEQRQNLWSRARYLLPDAQFQSLWLRYIEGMDVAEIATVLGKTQTHVKVLLFRARKTLAAELRSTDHEPLPQPEKHRMVNGHPAASPSPGGEGRPALRSAFDEGGGEGELTQSGSDPSNADWAVNRKRKKVIPTRNSPPTLGLTTI